jgi:hypothetical protein
MLRGLNEQELADLQAYDPSKAQPIAEGTQIQIASR